MNTRAFLPSRPRTSTRGFAVLALLAMLSIMLLLVAATLHTANWLRQEVKLVEKRQVERLAAISTNRPPAGVTGANPLPSP